MANEIHALPQADPALAAVLQLAHQTHKAFTAWRDTHPNDIFFRSHWDEIDDIDSGIIDIKCEIATLIGNDLVDHLQ